MPYTYTSARTRIKRTPVVPVTDPTETAQAILGIAMLIVTLVLALVSNS